MTSSTGVITSSNYPRGGERGLCHWTIKVRTGRKIEFQFLDLVSFKLCSKQTFGGKQDLD